LTLATGLGQVLPRSGTYTAVLVVTDSDGTQSNPVSATINVGNCSPVIHNTTVPTSANSSAVTSCGSGVVVSVSATDPEGSGLTYTYRVLHANDSSPVYISGTTGNTSFTFTTGAGKHIPREGDYTMLVTASDGTNSTTATSIAFSVGNCPPTTGLEDNLVSQSCGQVAQVEASAAAYSDPEGNPALQYQWVVTNPVFPSFKVGGAGPAGGAVWRSGATCCSVTVPLLQDATQSGVVYWLCTDPTHRALH
jgi:hypothetical protein